MHSLCSCFLCFKIIIVTNFVNLLATISSFIFKWSARSRRRSAYHTFHLSPFTFHRSPFTFHLQKTASLTQTPTLSPQAGNKKFFPKQKTSNCKQFEVFMIRGKMMSFLKIKVLSLVLSHINMYYLWYFFGKFFQTLITLIL